MAFPYHHQETAYTCGAASMKMALECFGIKKSEKQVARLLGTNKVMGTREKDFTRIAEKYRLTYLVERKGSISDLKRLHKQGFVIIVCFHLVSKNEDHYAVLKNVSSTHIYLYDPWFGKNHTYRISYFKRIWRTAAQKDLRWFIAIKKQ